MSTGTSTSWPRWPKPMQHQNITFCLEALLPHKVQQGGYSSRQIPAHHTIQRTPGTHRWRRICAFAPEYSLSSSEPPWPTHTPPGLVSNKEAVKNGVCPCRSPFHVNDQWHLLQQLDCNANRQLSYVKKTLSLSVTILALFRETNQSVRPS